MLLTVAIVGVTAPRVALAEPVGNVPQFERDVLPILSAHCAKCHGARDPEAGLDLTSSAALMKGSDEGPVVIKGSIEKSVLLTRIAAGKMPPPKENDPLSKEEVEMVRRWIAAGALTAGVEIKASASVEAPPQVTDEDRNFWAFRPPVAAPVPQAHASDRVRTPVDSFLLARLEAKGLKFSPDASRVTLIRRAYLDLLGLPPSPDEVRESLAEESPDAYERLVDRLLGSPQYGERWGRHWLDVAGYTDSPHCDVKGQFLTAEDWRYRDYVIRSFNADTPYDRFLTGQLAGDELVDWTTAPKYTPEILDALVATGYMRTTPDWTHGDQTQALVYRYDTVARVVENVATGVLGLTLGCARCHSHKFDPIPQQDYYRLLAVFATAYNLDDWKRPSERSLPDVSIADQDEIAAHNAHIDGLVAEHQKRLDELQTPQRQRLFQEKLATVPELLRDDVRGAFEIAEGKRDEVQKYLYKKFEAILRVTTDEARKALSAPEQSECTSHDQEIERLKKTKRSFGQLQALWDAGSPPAVHQLKRGDAETPGAVVEAGFLTVLCPPGQTAAVRPPETRENSSGRRLALAKWLTGRDHPLTARVLVNRIWQHHFGKGIVASPENFGHSGVPPTHPELLDWLAIDFMEHGWSIKRLHRLIMTSTAYRQSARRPASPPAADPDNELLWKMNLHRLEAETIRDAVLAVSGKLNPEPGGAPVPVELKPDGLVTVGKGPTATSQFRRSVYLRALRGSHPIGTGFKMSMMEIFDFPEIVINCTRRDTSTTPLQALALINSEFMTEQAGFFGDRVRIVAGENAAPARLIETAFELVFGRQPSEDELRFCQEFLSAQSEVYLTDERSREQAAQQALASLCLLLLASNEFLYNP